MNNDEQTDCKPGVDERNKARRHDRDRRVSKVFPGAWRTPQLRRKQRDPRITAVVHGLPCHQEAVPQNEVARVMVPVENYLSRKAFMQTAPSAASSGADSRSVRGV